MEIINNFLLSLNANSVLLAIVGFLIVHYFRSFASKQDLADLRLEVTTQIHRMDTEIMSIKHILDHISEKLDRLSR